MLLLFVFQIMSNMVVTNYHRHGGYHNLFPSRGPEDNEQFVLHEHIFCGICHVRSVSAIGWFISFLVLRMLITL